MISWCTFLWTQICSKRSEGNGSYSLPIKKQKGGGKVPEQSSTEGQPEILIDGSFHK